MPGTFAQKQRLALAGFYTSCLIFAVAVGTVGRASPVHQLLARSVAASAGFCGAFSLYAFFRTTDEFRRNINRRAMEFAFVGSLIASVALALLQTSGVYHFSPYMVPALMIILWSVGLILSSRRFE